MISTLYCCASVRFVVSFSSRMSLTSFLRPYTRQLCSILVGVLVYFVPIITVRWPTSFPALVIQMCPRASSSSCIALVSSRVSWRFFSFLCAFPMLSSACASSLFIYHQNICSVISLAKNRSWLKTASGFHPVRNRVERAAQVSSLLVPLS